MKRLAAFLACLPLLLAFALPAEAHKLKLFATVEGNEVTGYAFFIGGSRAMGVDWKAGFEGGEPIAAGKTDDKGQYDFTVPAPVTLPVTISVDTHEGHMAHVTLPAERFGTGDLPGLAAAPPTPSSSTGTSPTPAPAATPAALDEKRLAALTEAAVARQLVPLEEQIEALQDRLQFTDILSALFLIAGLAGFGLWLRDRLRRGPAE